MREVLLPGFHNNLTIQMKTLAVLRFQEDLYPLTWLLRQRKYITEKRVGMNDCKKKTLCIYIYVILHSNFNLSSIFVITIYFNHYKTREKLFPAAPY